MESYDYIIVGAGSAGCVLANRLSTGTARVLLIEAGGGDRHPYIEVPLGLGMLSKHRMFDWGYNSEPQPHLGDRRLPLARGKVVGGSSSTNFMAFTRGHAGDYDRWAASGLDGWAYAAVLPYFKRLETWSGPPSAYRGTSGPIGVQFALTSDPLFSAMLAAGAEAGFPSTEDYNGANAEGFGRSQYSIRGGRRSSTSAAYLRPALRRKNLRVLTDALTLRVLVEGTKACGVEYVRRNKVARVRAECEVIVSAGTYNSPKLLMLSGIGPAAHLREIGIDPIVDLPVGDNLQDHLFVPLQWKRREPGPFHATMRFDRIALGMVQGYLTGSGTGTIIPGGCHAFLKTQSSELVPDIEFLFRGAPVEAGPWLKPFRADYMDAYSIMPAILHPKSRGRVRLSSNVPTDPIRIDGGYLSDADDLSKLREGVAMAREVGNQAALQPFNAGERFPGDGVMSIPEVERYIRSRALSVSHPASTARMGGKTEANAVLDGDFAVRGIGGLRVVDASAMPDLVSAHINACVIMMAEKAADVISARWTSG